MPNKQRFEKEFVFDFRITGGIYLHNGAMVDISYLKNWIEKEIEQEKQRVRDDIGKIIAEEISIAIKEGDKTSRLTSLFTKIKGLK